MTKRERGAPDLFSRKSSLGRLDEDRSSAGLRNLGNVLDLFAYMCYRYIAHEWLLHAAGGKEAGNKPDDAAAVLSRQEVYCSESAESGRRTSQALER